MIDQGGEEVRSPSERDGLDPSIQIKSPLRCEGVGSLDCAEEADTGLRMAVRFLPLVARGDEATRAIQALASHPTLPRIHKVGTRGASAYVAMEFPEGQLLSTLLDAPLPAEMLQKVGAEVAGALASVHAQGVVHGELCADSLLLLPDGRALLWDMPLVLANRLTDRRGESRQLSLLVRLAPCLSPERARGRSPTAPSDVYALGAVLCLAAGAPAPTAVTTLGLVHQVATGKWSPRVPEHLTETFQSLLGRMMHPDPALRPTAGAVATMLQDSTYFEAEVTGTEAEVTGPDVEAPVTAQVERAAQRSTWALVAGAALLAVLGLVGVGLAHLPTPSAPRSYVPRSEGSTSAPSATGSLSTSASSKRETSNVLAASPAGDSEASQASPAMTPAPTMAAPLAGVQASPAGIETKLSTADSASEAAPTKSPPQLAEQLLGSPAPAAEAGTGVPRSNLASDSPVTKGSASAAEPSPGTSAVGARTDTQRSNPIASPGSSTMQAAALRAPATAPTLPTAAASGAEQSIGSGERPGGVPSTVASPLRSDASTSGRLPEAPTQKVSAPSRAPGHKKPSSRSRGSTRTEAVPSVPELKRPSF